MSELESNLDKVDWDLMVKMLGWFDWILVGIASIFILVALIQPLAYVISVLGRLSDKLIPRNTNPAIADPPPTKDELQGNKTVFLVGCGVAALLLWLPYRHLFPERLELCFAECKTKHPHTEIDRTRCMDGCEHAKAIAAPKTKEDVSALPIGSVFRTPNGGKILVKTGDGSYEYAPSTTPGITAAERAELEQIEREDAQANTGAR